MEEAQLNWYALKVFYNKVFEMEDRLAGMGLETYLAVEKVPLKGEEQNWRSFRREEGPTAAWCAKAR